MTPPAPPAEMERPASQRRPGSRIGDRLTQRGRDLGAEALDRARVVAGEDEGAEAVLEHQLQQLLDPLLRRALQVSVVEAAKLPWMLSSRRIRRGSRPASSGGGVDRGVGGGELLAREVGERRQPAVALRTP